MYRNQLIERTIENEPANEYLHGRDDLAWLPRLPGCLGSCSICAFSGGKLSYVPRLDVSVQVSFPSGYLATILEGGTTIKRGPSGFGSDEFVWMYLSKDIKGEMIPWVCMCQKCVLHAMEFLLTIGEYLYLPGMTQEWHHCAFAHVVRKWRHFEVQQITNTANLPSNVQSEAEKRVAINHVK